MRLGSNKYHNLRLKELNKVLDRYKLTIKDKHFIRKEIFMMAFNEGFYLGFKNGK